MSNESSKGSFVKIIIGIVILILVIILSIQNNTNTEVSILFWTKNAPLIILFLMCFLAGLIFALLAIMPIYRQSSRKSKLIKELQERIDLLEKKNV